MNKYFLWIWKVTYILLSNWIVNINIVGPMREWAGSKVEIFSNDREGKISHVGHVVNAGGSVVRRKSGDTLGKLSARNMLKWSGWDQTCSTSLMRVKTGKHLTVVHDPRHSLPGEQRSARSANKFFQGSSILIMGATARAYGDSVSMHSHTQAHTTCQSFRQPGSCGDTVEQQTRSLDGNRRISHSVELSCLGSHPGRNASLPAAARHHSHCFLSGRKVAIRCELLDHYLSHTPTLLHSWEYYLTKHGRACATPDVPTLPGKPTGGVVASELGWELWWLGVSCNLQLGSEWWRLEQKDCLHDEIQVPVGGPPTSQFTFLLCTQGLARADPLIERLEELAWCSSINWALGKKLKFVFIKHTLCVGQTLLYMKFKVTRWCIKC